MAHPRVRIREMGEGAIHGTITRLTDGAIVRNTAAGGGITYCSDVVGNREGDNPLLIYKQYWDSVGVSNGVVYDTWSFQDAAYDGQPGEVYHPSDIFDGMPANAVAITQIAARTNPSRPDVSIPNFLWELKELPKQLQMKGIGLFEYNARRRRRSRPSNSSVEQNFGWDPLFGDLFKLINFSATLDKRVAEMQQIRENGGLSRARNTWSTSRTSTTPVLLNSSILTITGYRTVTSTARQWGSVRWKPDNSFDNIVNAGEMRYRMLLAMHGWNLHPDKVWEALPWSWFIDYFTNVGDFIKATNNSVGISCSSGCVMVESKTVVKDVIAQVIPSIPTSASTRVRIVKERYPVSLGLGARAPLITGKQLVTLLSIAQNLGIGHA